MGVFPCIRCGQRFKGETQNVYLSRYEGEQRESYRFAVCLECCDQLVGEWRQRALYRDETGDWQLPDSDQVAEPRLYDADRPEKRIRGRK